MSTFWEQVELQKTTKRTLVGLSHAVEEIAEAAAGDATVIALFQHGAYFVPMQRRYGRLAETGATVIVGYAGDVPASGLVHHVPLGTTDQLSSEWSVVLITPTTGAYVRGLDLVDFDPGENDLESGRRFRATWGFDRVAAAQHIEHFLGHMESSLEPAVVERVRTSIASARRSAVSIPEQALSTTARILIDRLEATQRDLTATRRELAKETEIATRDPLTGMLNREGLERWLGGPETDGLPMPSMGVVLIDLDGFKQVNDTLGHLVGDKLLCQTAGALLSATRPGDVAARWGGDEFIVLCPHASDEELSVIAERLIGAIAAVDVDGAHVSASAGTKTCSRRPLPLGEADEALYAAKAAGGARSARAL